MDKKATYKKVPNRNDERKAEKRIRPKVLYNRKFTTPLRRKRKNEYDADEEARYGTRRDDLFFMSSTNT